MFKNYLKIAWRSLLKKKGFSFINITGLAIGMAAAMLIGLWIQNELSFDRFHSNIKNLYLAYNRSTFEGEINCWSTTPNPLGPALKQEFPEVASTVRVISDEAHQIDFNEKKLQAKGLIADEGFLNMFSFPLLSGNGSLALRNAGSMVITEDFAKDMFGSTDVAGKIIKVDNKYNLTISGVLKKLPVNTRFKCDFILPWACLTTMYGPPGESWGNNSFKTYVQLKANASINQVNKKLKI